MKVTTLRGLAVTALAITAATTAAGASAATATTQSARPEASVTGSARLFFPPFPKDQVRFGFDAHATYGKDGKPSRTWGKVQISHWWSVLNQRWWAEAEVDCVSPTGRVAIVTAVVNRTSSHLAGWKGKRIGFTVFDTGPDRPGRSHDQLGVASVDEGVTPCLESKPYRVPAPSLLVQEGGYKVRHNVPPTMPGA